MTNWMWFVHKYVSPKSDELSSCYETEWPCISVVLGVSAFSNEAMQWIHMIKKEDTHIYIYIHT